MTTTPHGQVPEALAHERDRAIMEGERNASLDAYSRAHALRMEQAAPKAAPGDALDEALRERDDAEDFINELLDEVLGVDRPEWSSAYNRYDAMNDVRERITALHKPAADKAWGRFESATAEPKPSPAAPSDAELFPLIEKHFGMVPRRDDTVIDRRNGRFHDAQRYRDFAADLLSARAQPTPPAVVEPLTDEQIVGVMHSIPINAAPSYHIAFARAIEAARGIKGVQHGAE